jgi:hypothetical protein
LKRFVGKVTSIQPLYLVIAGVVVVLLLAGGAFLIFGGGDDGNGTDKPDPTLGFAEGDASGLPGSKRAPQKQAPTVSGNGGVLDEARREGRLAVAQARGTINDPSVVRIRVNASPKQTVRVNWQLGCFKDRQAVIGRDEYRTRTPDSRGISVPVSGAKSCIATASAQLTRSDKIGRIKVAIIAGG